MCFYFHGILDYILDSSIQLDQVTIYHANQVLMEGERTCGRAVLMFTSAAFGTEIYCCAQTLFSTVGVCYQ